MFKTVKLVTRLSLAITYAVLVASWNKNLNFYDISSVLGFLYLICFGKLSTKHRHYTTFPGQGDIIELDIGKIP